jgi:small subunit ribosomal protein S3
MGQKVNPEGFRLGKNVDHSSVWFTSYNEISKILKEDYYIRKYLEDFFSMYYKSRKEDFRISRFKIKRKPNQTNVEIHSAKAERLVHFLSTEVEMSKFKGGLGKIVENLRYLRITIRAIGQPFKESRLAAQELARQIENRVSLRRALSDSVQELLTHGVRGVKIQVSGRLNGAEIARSEWIREGRVPLQTLNARISYAKQRAYTKYGIIGVKVWIFDKEVF